jgi:hypothetical protein
VAQFQRDRNDEVGLEWLDLDFTQGCYSNTPLSGASPAPIIPAPPGAADPNATQGCICLPQGGLAPLPGKQATYTYPIDFVKSSVFLMGFLVHGNLANGDTEVFAYVEADDGTNHWLQAFSFVPEIFSAILIVNESNPAVAGPVYYGSPWPAMTRVNATDPTSPGQPIIAFVGVCSTDANTGYGHLWFYPNPATPTSGVPSDNITPPNEIAGQLIVHQGRIVCLAGALYGYPVGGGFLVNEQVCYTDPANSVDYQFQQEIFVPEHPFGYGCAGSISASELFLVKQRDGGVVVTGDLNNPYVTYLPGVQSTGAFYGQAASTPGGLFYCSDGNGAWYWNGGNVSQKISPQLDDGFFNCANNVPGTQNMGFFCCAWGEWVLFSNNWLYDLRTNSWWPFFPQVDPDNNAPSSFFHYSLGRSTDELYAAPATIFEATPTAFWKFSRETSRSSYTWKSQPIRLTEYRYLNLRRIAIRASNFYGAEAGSTITVAVFVGGDNVFSATIPAGDIIEVPVTLQANLTSDGPADDITISLSTSSASSYAAPVIHSVALGYRTRQQSKIVV